LLRQPFTEIEDTAIDCGSVIVELYQVVRKVLEIAGPQVIPHGRASAARIDVGSTTPGDDVVLVDRPEVDAVASDPGRVLDGLVQLSAGERDDRTGRREKTHGHRVEFLLGPGLLACIALDVLGRGRAVPGVSLVVIVALRTILDRLAEVARVESHRVVGIE